MSKFPREISAMEVKATEENLIRYSTKHIQHLPPGTITEYYWKNYSPSGFRFIQELEDIDNVDYMHAICNNEIIEKLSSGKTGYVFHISTDERFLIKILRKSEVKVTLEMLPGFYKHLHNYRTSLFTRIYGVHAVQPSAGVKIYFAVMSNMLHSNMNKLYDLKGSLKGRTDKKVELRNTTILKDTDLDFCFYVDPVTRQRIIKQTTLDCEFLEEEGIMDYSLLIGLQVKDSSQGSGSVDEFKPAYGSFTPPCSFKTDSSNSMRTTSINSVQSENSMTTTGSVTSNHNTSPLTNQMNIKSKLDTLNDFVLKRSTTNFGMKIPARARKVKQEKEEEEEEWCDVVVYLGIVDTFQNYGMKKRLEHCYKSIQYNSKEISTVHPKIYSSRFQDLVSNIFLPYDDDLSLSL